jgi:hypothetical protein
MKTSNIALYMIDEDTFLARFAPLPNHLDPNSGFDLGSGGCLFAVTGPEYRYVRDQDPRVVWTLIEADGRLFIESGLHFVNRLGYLVTGVAVEPNTAYSVPLDMS